MSGRPHVAIDLAAVEANAAAVVWNAREVLAPYGRLLFPSAVAAHLLFAAVWRSVWRGRARPLAAGELTVREAMVLFALLMLAAFGLVLLTNALTVKLAFVGAALAASYPFCKRFTHLPQVVLGVAFGWSMIMAFAAETGAVPGVAWWLLAINTVWSVIYDTLYAMVDREAGLLNLSTCP